VKELLTLIQERLHKKEDSVLVTVTGSSGSVPRRTGAMMLVGEGVEAAPVRLWGSIGGGLTEHLAIEEAGKILRKEQPLDSGDISFTQYTLRPPEAADSGGICGGEISVSFRLVKEGKDKLLAEIEKEMAQGGFVYIFGGGHIAQELVPLLSHLDFRCVVFDDREEFSKPELFPGAEKVLLGDFKHIGRFVALSENDYAVIVTRGHLWDLEAWAFALSSQASYIGVIGSKTKHEAVKARLRERGFDDSSINAARVHAPIGMDIKSETPAEIAVSIAAELILIRARGKASI